MKKTVLVSLLWVCLPFSLCAQNAASSQTALSPSDIIAQASDEEWKSIKPSDLLVMTLSPNAAGQKREVIIQLLPKPFSTGWVNNIRKLATNNWWDGAAIVRVQDNYVTQWGDPNSEVADKAKPLPQGLAVMTEEDYVLSVSKVSQHKVHQTLNTLPTYPDHYGEAGLFWSGWPLARSTSDTHAQYWPVHCYGMVGVGRNYSPDTGTGAELYTVIGHAPRHLDQNIALVGRIIEGMQHMSSLPRGTGELSFYETPEERTSIISVRLMSELSRDLSRELSIETKMSQYEYLSTQSKTFARYVEARANRSDPFFMVPAGGVDICNAQVPVRKKS